MATQNLERMQRNVYGQETFNFRCCATYRYAGGKLFRGGCFTNELTMMSAFILVSRSAFNLPLIELKADCLI